MSDAPSPRRFFGGLLMAVGGLLAGFSGLCTGLFTIMSLAGQMNSHELDVPPWLPIMFGIVPILVGLALFFWGRRLLRSATPPSQSGPTA